MPKDSRPRWHKSGAWRFRFRGTDHYAKLGGPKDWQGAADWATAIKDAAAREERRWAAPTVASLAAWYLLWHARRGTAAKTLEQYDAMLRRFVGTVGADTPAADVRPADLRRADRELERAGLGSTRYHLAKVVLACWAWAARPEPDRATADGRPLPDVLLAANPLAGCRPPRVRRAVDRVAGRRHVAELLRAARAEVESGWARGTKGRCVTCARAGRRGPCRRSHDGTRVLLRDALVLVRLAAASGCRPGELCSAAWDGWESRAARDDAGNWWGLLLVDHKTQRHTGRRRPVVVPPLLARAIERIRARPGRHPERIWSHRRGRGAVARGAPASGEPWTTAALGRRLRQWREAARAAGRDVPATFSAYALRHGFFTSAAPAIGATAAALLGGNSAAVVERVYLHGRADDLVRQAAAARAASRAGGPPRATHPARP